MEIKADKETLQNNLNTLAEIAEWFEFRNEIDIEEGLIKLKQAAEIIKSIKKRLREINNEFEEIKIEIEEGTYDQEDIDFKEANVEGDVPF